MFNLQIIVILMAGRKQVWSLVMVSFFCEIWVLHLMLIKTKNKKLSWIEFSLIKNYE